MIEPEPFSIATPPRNAHRDPWERERLFAAMVCEVDAHGYEHTSVAAVAARAGLPEASFETRFASLEACFLETFDSLVSQIYAHVLSSYRSRESDCDWRASVLAAMSTLARAVSIHPAAARMCLLQARIVGPRAASRCDGAFALLEDATAQMLADAPERPELSPATVTAIAEGIWHALEAQLRDDLTEEPSELADTLLDLVVAHLRPAP